MKKKTKSIKKVSKVKSLNKAALKAIKGGIVVEDLIEGI